MGPFVALFQPEFRRCALLRLSHFARWDGSSDSPRPEPSIQHLLDRPLARVGEGRSRQPRLGHCLQRRVAVSRGKRLRQQRPQARVVVEVISEAVPLDADARLPARSALVRLISPFQQMQQEDAQAADQLALLRPPMLSISSAICSMSASASFPARKSSACWRLQAKKSRS